MAAEFPVSGVHQLFARGDLDLVPVFNSFDELLAYINTSALRLVASKHMSFAFFTLLIYDHLLTLPEEIKLVWLGRPSLVKSLFLLNSSLITCHSWLIVAIIFELMSMLTTTLIITYRIHAVLGNLRGMLPILLGIWGAQAAVSVVLVVILALVKAGHTMTVLQTFNVCIADLHSTRVWTIWIPSMFFHTLVFALLTWKVVSTPRDSQTPMLMLLIRDGMLYFTIVFIAFLFNLLVWAIAPISLAILPHDSVWCVCTMALSRLMLSVDGISSTAVAITSEMEADLEQIGARPLSTISSTGKGTANIVSISDKRSSLIGNRPMSLSAKRASTAGRVMSDLSPSIKNGEQEKKRDGSYLHPLDPQYMSRSPTVFSGDETIVEASIERLRSVREDDTGSLTPERQAFGSRRQSQERRTSKIWESTESVQSEREGDFGYVKVGRRSSPVQFHQLHDPSPSLQTGVTIGQPIPAPYDPAEHARRQSVSSPLNVLVSTSVAVSRPKSRASSVSSTSISNIPLAYVRPLPALPTAAPREIHEMHPMISRKNSVSGGAGSSIAHTREMSSSSLGIEVHPWLFGGPSGSNPTPWS
ncbi:hypothetical protein FRC15_010662 [Serendipita sp. 397]|nr:hypothetical protein FRC15_010662 [Serendipita sp. 397]